MNIDGQKLVTAVLNMPSCDDLEINSRENILVRRLAFADVIDIAKLYEEGITSFEVLKLTRLDTPTIVNGVYRAYDTRRTFALRVAAIKRRRTNRRLI